MNQPQINLQATTKSLPSFFDKLKQITTMERDGTFGPPLINFLRIAIRWNVLFADRVRDTDLVFTPVDVAYMMIDMKMARLENSFQDDSVLDVAGYASCVARMDEMLLEYGYDQGVGIFKGMTVSGMMELLQTLSRQHKARLEAGQ